MIKRLFTKRQTPTETPPPQQPGRFHGLPPSPNGALAVIGDIHGRLDCLNDMLRQLGQGADAAHWVFVGDYVDRGNDSAAVLGRLMRLSQARPDTTCLMGNHEEMMLTFLDDPTEAGTRWLRHGGMETLASFGVSGLHQRSDPHVLCSARDALRQLMPEGLEDWLRGLPRLHESGNIAVTHAGADPAKPIGKQKDAVLCWGHPEFGRIPRTDGIWVAHGHTVVDGPKQENGIISVDTGAYATGRLSAALLRAGQVEFLQARPGARR